MIDTDKSITLEGRLCRLADYINTIIGQKNGYKSACSIYLYDYRRDKYVLRASTEETEYLGKDELNISEANKEKFNNDDLAKIGFTVLTVLSKRSLVSKPGKIQEDARFSRFDCTQTEARSWEKKHFCEFPLKNVGSVMTAPIIFKKDDPAGGVVRVVRFKMKKNNNQFYFNGKDIIKLEEIIDKNIAWIQSGAFVSQLIELGTYMNISSLCSKAAEVFRNLLNSKGCSIFLIDEIESSKVEKVYKCYGTTGLVKRTNSGDIIDIKDPINNEDAWYIYNTDIGNENNPTMPLTTGVIRARTSAFVNNIYNTKEIQKQFTKDLKIKRNKGIGKVCEKFTTVDGKYLVSESILYSPMFFCDPNNKYVDVLGVVRVVRPKDKVHNPFTKDQIHLFVSLVERLSKAVMNAKLIHFFDELSKIDKQNQLLEYVVSNIPKYIGANECAILLVKSKKLVKWASWQEGITTVGGKESDFYDLSTHNEIGYTYYVAKHNHTLMFNGKEDLKKQFEYRTSPMHKPASGKDPYRFLGIPINDTYGRLIAVIRICKDEKATRITDEDKQMLERIANRLKSRLELFRQEENKAIELNSKIPFPLQEQIKNLNNINCKERIKNFINNKHSIETTEKSVLNFIPELWEFYKPTFGNRPLNALKKFELFNTKILSEIPFYRDHFIHQFVVFLIGLCVLDKIEYKFLYSKAYAPYNNNIKREDVEAAWFLTSLFHDVAYPLQTANKWFWNILDIFIADSATKKYATIPVDSILFSADYLDSIDLLVNFHLNSLKRDENNLRRTIIDVLSKRPLSSEGLDHGIMGALMLLSDKRFELEKILPCSSAIALHNKLCEHRDVDNVVFEKHPLAFLLIYCDLLHEWGRSLEQFQEGNSEKNPMLLKMVYIEKNTNISEQFPDINIYDENCIYNLDAPSVYCEIQIDRFYERKIEEARVKFDRLKSSTVNFLVKINRELFSTRPPDL